MRRVRTPRSTRTAKPKLTPRERARLKKHNVLLLHERGLWATSLVRIAGVDEVGAGPLAGPVVAACVVLDPARTDALVGVNDSKQLSPAARDTLDEVIRTHALAFAYGECTVEEIDRLNIRVASMLAMKRALEKVEATLGPVCHLLVDAHRLTEVDRPQTAIIKGDATSLTIAAASVIAKVARDRTMDALHDAYPGYGFDKHKGYATAEHRDALRRLGPTPHHRRSFITVRESESRTGDLFGHVR